MQTVHKPFMATIEVKQSKFIAHLVPIAQFGTLRDRLRTEHPKASHIVPASRALNEHGQVLESSSDDGEPKGCAGVPVLITTPANSLNF